MKIGQSHNSVATRVLALVSIATLVSSLVVSWIAIDSQHTALRDDLERRYPTALERHQRSLESWLASQSTDFERVLADPENWLLLEVGLDEVRRDATLSLLIVDGSGRSIAGALEPAPYPSQLAAALPTLATPRELGGPGAVVFATASAIGNTGFHLVGGVDRNLAFAPARAVALRVLVADICLIALFTLLAERITRRILEPIHALSVAAGRVSRGELNVRLELPHVLAARDEVGVLARTFESMLRRLRTNRREIEHNHERLKSKNSELLQANGVLEQLSITDGLTKVHNHRYFQELLVHEARRIERTGADLSLILIDLDDFKRLNDSYGHAAGDQILCQLAHLLNEAIRESDVLARYGGEEFVVLSNGTDLLGAQVLAEKIRLSIEQSDFRIDEHDNPLLVTVSIGVAEYAGCCRRLFRSADAALYRAKDQGKNCVVEAIAGDGTD